MSFTFIVSSLSFSTGITTLVTFTWAPVTLSVTVISDVPSAIAVTSPSATVTASILELSHVYSSAFLTV